MTGIGGTPSTEPVLIASPIATAPLQHLLDQSLDDLPRGLGAASVTRLVGALAEQGVPVTVVTCTDELGPGEEVVASGPGLRIRYGPWRARGRGRDALALERAYVQRAVADEPPQLVNAHWTYEFALGAIAAKRTVVTTVRDWGPTILWHQRDAYRTVRLGMQAVALARSHHLMANSPYLGRRVARWTRRPVDVVGNPISEALFDHTARDAPSATPRIVAVNSGWGRRKNVATLLEAFTRVQRRIPESRLELIGHGYDFEGPAADWARSRGLTEGVDFRGVLGQLEVPRALRDADVLVHPAREESFGNVLVEAMAQGTPVIGGRSSGAVPWVLDDGRAGVLTDVEDPSAVAEAIVALLTDPERWRGVGNAGRRHAWDQFRSARVAEAYRVVYDRVRSQQDVLAVRP